jgi:hypothetical protein
MRLASFARIRRLGAGLANLYYICILLDGLHSVLRGTGMEHAARACSSRLFAILDDIPGAAVLNGWRVSS